ncbi:MAG TPA: DUF416 family protein [Terriglobales bacterium]|nr:DUF416 family protein [Terriglobales bacterium]
MGHPPKEGVSVISSSEKALRPAVRALLGSGDVAAQGAGHAEVSGVNAAKQMGLTPTGVAASRPICSACAQFLRSLGINALSSLKVEVKTMVGEEKKLLACFSQTKRLAFALLIFERMLPRLIAFSNDTGFDNSCYLNARDAAWVALQCNGIDHIDQSLTQACLNNAPDTEAFSHNLTSYALNAALAIGDILEFIVDGRTDHITYISTLATDSIYLYLSGLSSAVVSSSHEGEEIAQHVLMQQEVQRQEDDIRFLSELPDQFDNKSLAAVRARARSQASLLPDAPS